MNIAVIQHDIIVSKNKAARFVKSDLPPSDLIARIIKGRAARGCNRKWC
jgi:hypothetical protein